MSRNQDRLGGAQQPDTSPPPQQGGGGFSFVVPTEYVDLPSQGRFYPQGHPLHNEDSSEIKQMTAKEEDILTSETLIRQGVALDRVIGSLIKDKRIDPSSLLIGDRSAIVIASRRSGYGNIYESTVNCPSCGSKEHFAFDLNDCHYHNGFDSELGQHIGDGIFALTLPRTGLDVTIRLLNGYDESEMIKENGKRKKRNKAEANITSQLKRIVRTVKGSTEPRAIKYFSENIPTSESKFLRDAYKELAPNVEMITDFACGNCSFTDELEVPLNAEFFWPK